MFKKRYRRAERGQGLVEYALIIALAAIAVVLIVGAIGWAAQRAFGLVGGALGAKKEVQSTGSNDYVYFDTNQPPRCGYLTSANATGLYVLFYTNTDPTALIVSTDTGFVTTINQVSGGPSDYYAIQSSLASGNHSEMCPHSIVIQTSGASQGITAVSPVVSYTWP